MSENHKIRFLLLADTHLGCDYPVKPRTHRRRRGVDFFNNFERILKHAVEARVDFVVHGGDLFFRSKIPKKIVDLVYHMIFEFMVHGIKLFIVPGNHERSILPGSLLLTHPHIHIFDKPRTFLLDVQGARIALSGFPCVRESIRQEFPNVLKETGWNEEPADIRMLCLHQAVEGATVGPKNFTFRHGHDVIRMVDLPDGLHAVLAGHIHRQQVLVKPAGPGGSPLPVIYPGSIERTSFAEKEEEKGFYEIEISSDGAGRWGPPELKFVKLPARPMMDLVVDGALRKEDLIDFFRTELTKMDPDAIVRIRNNGTISESVRAAMTSVFFKDVFPDTMNYQLSSSFFRNPGGR